PKLAERSDEYASKKRSRQDNERSADVRDESSASVVRLQRKCRQTVTADECEERIHKRSPGNPEPPRASESPPPSRRTLCQVLPFGVECKNAHTARCRLTTQRPSARNATIATAMPPPG